MLRRNVNVTVPRHAATLRLGAVASPVRCIYNYNFGQVPLGMKFQSGPKQSYTAPSPADAAAAAHPVEAAAGKVQTTQLHNGAHVITHQLGGALAAVGAYIRAGPVYDPSNCPGVAAMMHLALTTSNYNNSLFQLDRNIRSVGAAQEHFELYKHYIAIRVDVRADKWRSSVTPSRVKAGAAVAVANQQQQPLNLSIMQDNIFSCLAAPRFHETDIERFRDNVDNQLKEMKWQNPAVYATHMLETVAFYREPLGSPRFVPEINNGNITSKVLLDHYSRYIVPSNVVIAGVNVDHDALIAEYENTPYPHSASSPHHARAAAAAEGASTKAAASHAAVSEMKQYTGGERLDQEDRAKDMGTRPDMDVDTICSLGFLSYGRDVTMMRDYAACLVYQQLMDMQLSSSVAYTRCGGDYSLPGVRSFYSPFQTAGLLGFTVISPPGQMVKLITDTAAIMRQLVPSTSASTLAVARHRAALNFLNAHADNVRDYCDYLGTSLAQTHNTARVMNLEDVTHAIGAVEAKDIVRVSETMFSHPASLYGHGEVLGIPSLRQMGLK